MLTFLSSLMQRLDRKHLNFSSCYVQMFFTTNVFWILEYDGCAACLIILPCCKEIRSCHSVWLSSWGTQWLDQRGCLGLDLWELVGSERERDTHQCLTCSSHSLNLQVWQRTHFFMNCVGLSFIFDLLAHFTEICRKAEFRTNQGLSLQVYLAWQSEFSTLFFHNLCHMITFTGFSSKLIAFHIHVWATTWMTLSWHLFFYLLLFR